MKLRDLLRNVDTIAVTGDLDTEVTSVVSDSRLTTRGSLFVAVPGLQQDGSKFIAGAVEKGAVVIVSETPLGAGDPLAAPRSPLAVVDVKDARAALSLIAANFYGNPAGKLS